MIPAWWADLAFQLRVVPLYAAFRNCQQIRKAAGTRHEDTSADRKLFRANGKNRDKIEALKPRRNCVKPSEFQALDVSLQ